MHKIMTCLSLYRSMISSGEHHSPTSDQAYADAQSEAHDLNCAAALEWKYVTRDGNPTDRNIYLVVKRDGGFRIGIFYAGAWRTNFGISIEDVYAYCSMPESPPLEPEGEET